MYGTEHAGVQQHGDLYQTTSSTQFGQSDQHSDASTSSASFMPASMIPQPPSRPLSRKRSNMRGSHMRPLSPERSITSSDASPSSAGVMADQHNAHNNQMLRQSWGITTEQPNGRDQAVPVIPRWVPPHPTFSNQIVDRSAGEGGHGMLQKPSRFVIILLVWAFIIKLHETTVFIVLYSTTSYLCLTYYYSGDHVPALLSSDFCRHKDCLTSF